MKILVPDKKYALLSAPSKMPCFSFGLPARKSCPRANGTICNGTGKGKKDGCYAFERGFYGMSNVKASQQARFDWTRRMLQTDAGLNEWVTYMVDAIKRATHGRREKLFRIHDSGDFFSARYAYAWYLVCQQLPFIAFWAPFRGWQQPTCGNTASGLNPFKVMTEADGLLSQLLALAALPNVTLRPSALNFGDDAPKVKGFHAGSTASESTVDGCYPCPAKQQDNNCGSCRVCWHAKSTAVMYAKH